MTPRSQAHTSIVTDSRGVVFLEFLIAFVPLWTFALAVFQLALISQANLVVRHAADSAARSASVVLPDDPSEYGGESKRSAGGSPNAERPLRGSTQASTNFADALGSASMLSRALARRARSKLDTIRLSAQVPLMPLSPRTIGETETSVEAALPTVQSVVTALLHQPAAVTVTFPGAVGETIDGPEVTVRVTYAYPCAVPVARRLLCDRFVELGDGDVEQAPSSLARGPIAGRFLLLQHQATLLLHDAPYQYRPRES